MAVKEIRRFNWPDQFNPGDEVTIHWENAQWGRDGLSPHSFGPFIVQGAGYPFTHIVMDGCGDSEFVDSLLLSKVEAGAVIQE